ncbi:MAG: FKBP-type peptidyl-prolyl cis-trans isomerase [Planctomycetales bacterium]|nr:FKBP-type peptidyl-prolyl cis-trans isomerase [Planctomycetales bacterium]
MLPHGRLVFISAWQQSPQLSLLFGCLLGLSLLGCRSGASAPASVADTPPLDSAPVIAARSAPPTREELAAAGPFSHTSSGLGYRVLVPGSGKKPRSTDRVRVHYHGWLDDGTVFDSSYERGSTTTFALDGVVKGWTEGLQYVSPGGKIELVVPPGLGYGSRAMGEIPPNSTLHFVVELIAINP